jgi:pilus assembly protein CpaF
MAAGLGSPVGVVERIGRAIALGDSALREEIVEAEADRMLALESPWRADSARRSVVNHVIGLGPIQGLVDDPTVTDVLVNGPHEVWVDRGGPLKRVDVEFESIEHLIATVERAIAPLGLRIDRSAPMVDARLPDGSRLHAVLPPASVDVPLLAIRRFTQRLSGPGDLVATGTATSDEVDLLVEAVACRQTVVVSGGTGAGKTTLLNVLGQAIPAGERVVVIEDASELSLPGHVVKLEARPPNSEGVGQVTINSLLRSALRLRPDRIIVGEVRGEEALDLIWALNTGHRGSLTTVHANSPQEAIWRIETLAMSAGVVADKAISRQLRAAVDIVVQLERLVEGRRITSITPMSRLNEDLA